ncbi:hypothetical protein DFJ74DRAFT_767525 [Hyaloraphidium curvatum]|nr:hypothetical protein DFJ74DRAFT_767525 [Hyaloraphidium curvatum]
MPGSERGGGAPNGAARNAQPPRLRRPHDAARDAPRSPTAGADAAKGQKMPRSSPENRSVAQQAAPGRPDDDAAAALDALSLADDRCGNEAAKTANGIIPGLEMGTLGPAVATRRICDACPFDRLVALALRCEPPSHAADEEPGEPQVVAIAFAIVDVPTATIEYSSEIPVGRESGEDDGNAPLARALAELDGELQSAIIAHGRSLCLVVHDAAWFFDKAAAGEAAEAFARLPAYFNAYFDVAAELRLFVSQSVPASGPGSGSPPGAPSPLEQLLPPSARANASAYADSRGVERALAIAQLCAAILAAPPGDAPDPLLPFTRATPRTEQPSTPRRGEPKPGDWRCPSCGYPNYAARRHCNKCLAPHPAESPPPFPPSHMVPMAYPGFAPWPMGAGFQPPPMRPPFRPDGSYDDMRAPVQPIAVLPQPLPFPHAGTPPSPADGEWPPVYLPGAEYPGFSPPRLSQKVLPGDWICGVCGVNNFSSRMECVACRSGSHLSSGTIALVGGYYPRAPAPMAYPVAVPAPYPTRADGHYGSKPRPTDRPGDWNCPNPACKYHNYASRTACYRCQAPRPTHPMVGMARPVYPYYPVPVPLRYEEESEGEEVTGG